MQKKPFQFGQVTAHYIDYHSMDELALAKLSENLLFQNFLNDPEIVLLKTCHRIEIYTTKILEFDPIKNLAGIDSQKIEVTSEALVRLIKIATGVLSKIKGEKFIFEQVRNALDERHSGSKIEEFFNIALEMSELLRNEFNFYAEKDYDDLVMDFVSKKAFFDQGQNIIIVGGGMLARSFFYKLRKFGKTNINIITRSPKKLAKTLGLKKGDKTSCFFNNLPENSITSAFQCFIATNKLEDENRQAILKLINHPNCVQVLDFSAVPVLDPFAISEKKYLTMYHQNFNGMIERSNIFLQNIEPRITDSISSIIQHSAIAESLY